MNLPAVMLDVDLIDQHTGRHVGHTLIDVAAIESVCSLHERKHHGAIGPEIGTLVRTYSGGTHAIELTIQQVRHALDLASHGVKCAELAAHG
jgi:hypothetical protein